MSCAAIVARLSDKAVLVEPTGGWLLAPRYLYVSWGTDSRKKAPIKGMEGSKARPDMMGRSIEACLHLYCWLEDDVHGGRKRRV